MRNYEPTSLAALIGRIGSFRFTTYPPGVPTSLDPLSAALKGWSNEGARGRLVCETCEGGFIVLPPPTTASSSSMGVAEGRGGGWTGGLGERTRKYYEAMIDKEGHKSGCPWRVTATRRSLYRLTSQSGATRSSVLAEFNERISNLDSLDKVGNTDPLSKDDDLTKEGGRGMVVKMDILEKDDEEELKRILGKEVRREVLVLALLGWSISPSTFSAFSLAKDKTDERTIKCQLCTRRLLLSPFLSLPTSSSSTSTPLSTSTTTTAKPRKQFDPLNSHHHFCPYISHTTPMSSSSDNPGWKKTLQVILLRNEPTLKVSQNDVSPFSFHDDSCEVG